MKAWNISSASLAALAAGADHRRNAAAFGRLRTQRYGFRTGPTGAWLWDVTQTELEAEVDWLKGPIVDLMAMVGMPLTRFRSAVPEELFAGAMAEALGRRLFELAAAAQAKGLDPEGALRQEASRVAREVETAWHAANPPSS